MKPTLHGKQFVSVLVASHIGLIGPKMFGSDKVSLGFHGLREVLGVRLYCMSDC